MPPLPLAPTQTPETLPFCHPAMFQTKPLILAIVQPQHTAPLRTGTNGSHLCHLSIAAQWNTLLPDFVCSTYPPTHTTCQPDHICSCFRANAAVRFMLSKLALNAGAKPAAHWVCPAISAIDTSLPTRSICDPASGRSLAPALIEHLALVANLYNVACHMKQICPGGSSS